MNKILLSGNHNNPLNFAQRGVKLKAYFAL